MDGAWPGNFLAGEKVQGVYGVGVVATADYCLGRGEVFKGMELRNVGIRFGLVPVIFETVGCFWQAPWQLKRLIK